MQLLKEYFELQKKIYDYFGYREDWVVIPLMDETDKYWFVTGETGTCVYADVPFTEEVIIQGKQLYTGPIYTQRFLPKWIYRGEEYTMICVDTRTDGNKFLSVFSNDKECHDETMKNVYFSQWGDC